MDRIVKVFTEYDPIFQTIHQAVIGDIVAQPRPDDDTMVTYQGWTERTYRLIRTAKGLQGIIYATYELVSETTT